MKTTRIEWEAIEGQSIGNEKLSLEIVGKRSRYYVTLPTEAIAQLVRIGSVRYVNP